jgi:asparagine synthase (glutamine-hydrolysing)
MCGIFAIIGNTTRSEQELAQLTCKCTEKLRHRGPDEFTTEVYGGGWAAFGFARLAINDPAHGHQPMRNDLSTVFAITNGEIYNHEEIRRDALGNRPLHSHSDCEVIIPLYEKLLGENAEQATSRTGPALVERLLLPAKTLYDMLRGVFASVLVDLERGVYVAARDPVGVRGMFVGASADGAVWIASEAKALVEHCDRVEAFKPGTLIVGVRGQERATAFTFEPWYVPRFLADDSWTPTAPANLQLLHDAFVVAVRRRLMADVPVGVFISGGLDSSLVAAVAKRYLAPDYVFHSFACGLAGSPDLAAARRVAEFLKTEHHELIFTVEEGIAALDRVIYHLETYDVTTVRASTPMYLLSKLVKQYVKVILSGEGADEVLGGYLYFHNAPSAAEFQRETVRRLRLLYTADVLRGDRSTAAHCLELRVPFLDRDYLDVAMTIDPQEKMCVPGKRMEKWIMRAAFDEHLGPARTRYLPDDILWRQKEQFSDGVGYNWIDGLKAFCDSHVSDDELHNAAARFTYDPPTTKEAYYYRMIFEKHYGSYPSAQSLRSCVHKWIPLWSESTDPSGRAQRVHVANARQENHLKAPQKQERAN